ncbi:MAG: sugar transferase [Eubacteriales bacterium]|nr:sugar transferase [Eubacteriales bacterium]
MQDITELSKSQKAEIASYIARDNLAIVNAKVKQVTVKDTFYTRYGKRAIDIVISLFALIVTLPINFFIAIITFFDVGSPIIFKQHRVGRNEKIFTIYKFRNMTNETDANGELLPPSERVTKWGNFVRKTSLDELLNFVSILNGSMSIIGPRPLLEYYAERLNVRHKKIYAVRPGLECPTLNKVDHTLSWQERLENYIWYVENCSFWIDVKLAFRIVQIAFDRKSTAQRADASHGGLLGYDLEGNVIYTKSVPDHFVEEFCKKHGYKNLEDAVSIRIKDANKGKNI